MFSYWIIFELYFSKNQKGGKITIHKAKKGCIYVLVGDDFAKVRLAAVGQCKTLIYQQGKKQYYSL